MFVLTYFLNAGHVDVTEYVALCNFYLYFSRVSVKILLMFFFVKIKMLHLFTNNRTIPVTLHQKESTASVLIMWEHNNRSVVCLPVWTLPHSACGHAIRLRGFIFIFFIQLAWAQWWCFLTPETCWNVRAQDNDPRFTDGTPVCWCNCCFTNNTSHSLFILFKRKGRLFFCCFVFIAELYSSKTSERKHGSPSIRFGSTITVRTTHTVNHMCGGPMAPSFPPTTQALPQNTTIFKLNL